MCFRKNVKKIFINLILSFTNEKEREKNLSNIAEAQKAALKKCRSLSCRKSHFENCTSRNEVEASPIRTFDLIFIQSIPRQQEFRAIKQLAIFRRVCRA